MIISSQRTPKCAHLDSSLRRQKTNKISRVPVVHIKSGARNAFGRQESGDRAKRPREKTLFLCAAYLGRDFLATPRERPDWPSFFSLTLMLRAKRHPTIHHNPFSLSVLQISKSFTS
jgi:hypothetical protein